MKKWMGRVLVSLGMALMAFPVLQLEYGKARTGEMLEVLESEMEVEKVSVSVENSGDGVSGDKEDNGVEDTVESIEDSISENAQGEVIGMIEIDRIGIRYPLVEGAGQDELRYAVGHVSSTAGIGEYGNCVLAGHRGSRYGEFFKRLGEVKVGDEIRVTSLNGSEYCYEVAEMFVVEPDDVRVMEQDGDERVTLISCENGGKKRLVAYGKRWKKYV